MYMYDTDRGLYNVYIYISLYIYMIQIEVYIMYIKRGLEHGVWAPGSRGNLREHTGENFHLPYFTLL